MAPVRSRFGVTGRLVAIGLVGFLALVTLFGALLFRLTSQEGALARAFPLPAQIASIVSVLDTLPSADREKLLGALNSQSVSVAISKDLPSEGGNTRRLPLIEDLLRGFDPLRDRELRVMSEGGDPPMPSLDAWANGVPLMVVAELADGDFVVIGSRGMFLQRLLGIPNGYWVAAASLVIAALTLVALARETRPLRDLTAALHRFSRDAKPAPVKPGGATDLRALIETVNRMQERIGALVKGRTVLASAISHDLKTYLTRMQLRSEAIANPVEREAAERDIAAMVAIVENATSFARSVAGTRGRSVIDLGVLAETEVARLQSPTRPIDFRAKEATYIVGDAIALTRVVGNLIENAQRYATAVLVTVEARANKAVLTVDDNGPGIPTGEREAVFEPFYRLDESRSTVTGGSGLGLAFCRQIIDAHGGEISITESPMGGAQVNVALDRADRMVPEGEPQ